MAGKIGWVKNKVFDRPCCGVLGTKHQSRCGNEPGSIKCNWIRSSAVCHDAGRSSCPLKPCWRHCIRRSGCQTGIYGRFPGTILTRGKISMLALPKTGLQGPLRQECFLLKLARMSSCPQHAVQNYTRGALSLACRLSSQSEPTTMKLLLTTKGRVWWLALLKPKSRSLKSLKELKRGYSQATGKLVCLTEQQKAAAFHLVGCFDECRAVTIHRGSQTDWVGQL